MFHHGALRVLRVSHQGQGLRATAPAVRSATTLRLRDRVGGRIPGQADAGCRNTVFNINRAQTGAEYFTRFLALGARAFRVEFLNETPEELVRTVGAISSLLRGEIIGAAFWREFKLINQLGVTRARWSPPAGPHQEI